MSTSNKHEDEIVHSIHEIKENNKLKPPYCPYCLDGLIVKDNNMKGVYFCNRCFKQIKIITFKESLKR